jgi:hypothetical protein
MPESGMARAAAQSVRVAAGPRSDMLGFVAIFAAALAGFGGLGVWVVGASAIALASLSYAEHYQLYRRGQELGLTEVLRTTTLRSFGNALMAAGSAYAGGVLLRLL